MTASLVPRWAEADGNLLKNIDDPALHQRLAKEMTENLRRRGGAKTLLMTAAKDKSIVGKNLRSPRSVRSRPSRRRWGSFATAAPMWLRST